MKLKFPRKDIFSFGAISLVGLGLYCQSLEKKRLSFEEISESLIIDLRSEHGTNIVVSRQGKEIHLSFPYGRSNFVYVVNVENYYQVFEP